MRGRLRRDQADSGRESWSYLATEHTLDPPKLLRHLAGGSIFDPPAFYST